MLRVNRKSIITFWPHDVICKQRENSFGQKGLDFMEECLFEVGYLVYFLQPVGLFHLTCNDLSKQLLWSVSKERHTTHQELIQDDAHRPPVHWLPVTLTENHLWSNILWSPTYLKEKQNLIYSDIYLSSSADSLSQHSDCYLPPYSFLRTFL